MILIGGGLLALAGTLNGEVGKTGKTILNWSGSVSSIPAGGGIGDNNPDVHTPDPVNGTAFAIYSETDHSLDFYKRKAVPEVGTTFEGKVVTEVYTGFETDIYTGTWPDDDCPWYARARTVLSAAVKDEGIKPVSVAWWFNQFNKCTTIDLKKLDVSRCLYLDRLFSSCGRALITGLETWDTSSVKSMDAAFDGTKLTDYSFCWGWNVSKVENFSSMFYNCPHLETIDLSRWDCSSWAQQRDYWFQAGTINGGYQGSARVIKVNESSSNVLRFYDPLKSYGTIPNADGKWYARSDGKAYLPNEVPRNKADTYYASKSLYEQAVGKVK